MILYDISDEEQTEIRCNGFDIGKGFDEYEVYFCKHCNDILRPTEDGVYIHKDVYHPSNEIYESDCLKNNCRTITRKVNDSFCHKCKEKIKYK
jgi:hypothetical protein